MIDIEYKVNLNPKLGQVLTPYNLACKMIEWAKDYLPKDKYIKILDPAVGPATFLKAVRNSALKVDSFDCYDVDKSMCEFTEKYSSYCNFRIKVINKDYLLENKKNIYDFIVLNPPYIRQENLDVEYKKSIKHNLLNDEICSINGRSNLFIYFMYKSLQQLDENGVMCAIVYDSIMHTKYGQDFMKYAYRYFHVVKCQNISAPFDGAIIDASILIIKKEKPFAKNTIFDLKKANNGYVYLSSLLNIRRGTTLPSRQIFLAHPIDGENYSYSFPIIMKPNDREALITSNADSRYYKYGVDPKIDNFLSKKAMVTATNNRQLTFKESSGKILLNYYIRNKPKHIFNVNNITASDNFYVCQAENFPDEVAWLLLNSELYCDALLSSTRNQGNGLRKLQVYEYKNTLVPNWNSISSESVQKFLFIALSLIKHNTCPCEVRSIADKIIKEVFLK